MTEVPLLYETGADGRFDKVVVITAPAERPPRPLARARDEQRERRLLPDDEKAARADYVYVNTGSLAELEEFVGSVWTI